MFITWISESCPESFAELSAARDGKFGRSEKSLIGFLGSDSHHQDWYKYINKTGDPELYKP